MKFEVSRRLDSRGFTLRTRVLTLAAHWWPRWRRFPGACVTLNFGQGAGYIGGATAFLAVNAKGGGLRWLHTPAPFRAGLTRNGNGVPYHFRGG
jgi:hypothetical protein